VKEKLARLLKNRGGAVIAGIAAAAIAVILLIIYLNSYRSSVNSGQQPERVLVATKLIKAGTSAHVIATQHMYQVVSIQKDQLLTLALTDPSQIAGSIAATEILPGQQFVQSDFTTSAPQGLAYQLAGNQRAIAIPVDAIHGLSGELSAGNFIDIYTSVGGTIKLVASDVYILVPPGGASGSAAVLRVFSNDVARFAAGADFAKYWFILRPQVGAQPTVPSTATLATLLANSTTGG
jgi:hypothetical protein